MAAINKKLGIKPAHGNQQDHTTAAQERDQNADHHDWKQAAVPLLPRLVRRELASPPPWRLSPSS